MRFLTPLLLSFTLLTAFQPSHAQDGDAALRTALENAYHNWRQAIIRKDPLAWASSITRYRQTVMRNSIVSERSAFPDAVFASGVQPLALDGLRLLEAQAVGDTAHLVYFGKIDLGQDRELVRDDVLKLKFLRENGQWKFDSNRITSLTNAPDVRQALKEGKRPEFLDTPEFTPPGVAPQVPPLCRVPDHKAGYKIQSFGYETTVSMNGFDYDPVGDGLAQQMITGGLVNGHNEITLKIKPIEVPKGEKAALQIRVYLLSNDPEKPGKEVLRWQVPESGAPDKITLPIEVRP
ncbi:MAG TPA: hypothetical protein DDZ88_26065 [Verrucomicrobiales bacterium]|nr:hypothetical protein [Verrucomicrobiales bacterium]